MSSRYFTRSIFVVSAMATLVGCGPREAAPARPAGTVRIEFVVGDETRTVSVDGVADGTKLETVMRGIQEVPVEIRGSGVTAFVNEIDGVATSQSEGWTFLIDGEFAGEGIGSLELHPPTTVTWRFGSADEAP